MTYYVSVKPMCQHDVKHRDQVHSHTGGSWHGSSQNWGSGLVVGAMNSKYTAWQASTITLVMNDVPL